MGWDHWTTPPLDHRSKSGANKCTIYMYIYVQCSIFCLKECQWKIYTVQLLLTSIYTIHSVKFKMSGVNVKQSVRMGRIDLRLGLRSRLQDTIAQDALYILHPICTIYTTPNVLFTTRVHLMHFIYHNRCTIYTTQDHSHQIMHNRPNLVIHNHTDHIYNHPISV